MGKNPEELEVAGGPTYKESQLEELRKYLCTISDVDNKTMQGIKEKIARDYKQVLPEDVRTKGKSFSEEKLEKILSILHLQLKKEEKRERREGKTTKKTYYSILEEGEEPEKEAEFSEDTEEI